MGRRPAWILGAALILASTAFPVQGFELETKHATVVYTDEGQLRDFNRSLRLKSLFYLLWNRKSVEAKEEARNKVDAIVEKVEAILEMQPKALHFRILLLANREEVDEVYRKKFERYSDFIAFYCPEEKTVYVSVDDVSLQVLAHEIAHVVIDRYFGVPAPVKVHELLAQYVEAQINP